MAVWTDDVEALTVTVVIRQTEDDYNENGSPTWEALVEQATEASMVEQLKWGGLIESRVTIEYVDERQWQSRMTYRVTLHDVEDI